MHEFALMKDLIQKIEHISEELGKKKIISIKVTLGALSHISAEHFREHFEEAIQETAAAGTRLHIVQLTDHQDPNAQEIILESVEVEE